MPFHISRPDFESGLAPVGLLRPEVLRALRPRDGPCPWEFVRTSHDDTSDVVCVTFAPDVLARGREAMNAAMADTAARWKADGLFAPALDGTYAQTQQQDLGLLLIPGWRDELYAIYASPRSSAFAQDAPRRAMGNAAFACERAACAVWGFATFGVHMTGKRERERESKSEGD